MDDPSSLSSIALVVSLIGLHALLQMGSAAFSNFRRTPMRERADSGEAHARRMMRVADDLPRLRLTVQMTLMFVRFAVVIAAYTQLALPFAETLSTSQITVASPLGAGLVLFVAALVTYAIGEVAASAVGQVYADQLIAMAAPPLRLLKVMLAPLVWLLTRLDAWIGSWTGSEAIDKAVTEEEIMTLIDESQLSGGIEDNEKEMIYSVLQFGETLVREVMVPRPDITAVPISATIGDAVKTFMESGHSRVPVFDGEIDDIRGLLYAKDLLRLFSDPAALNQHVVGFMRQAYFVPETKRADALFEEMQHRKTHIAVVVDEYGGTAGIVTIEDLIEEIVGDIKDEYDATEEDDYTQVEPNAYLVDGGINLGDLSQLLEIDLPDDESDSLGGYIYGKLGRVPEVGDTIEDMGLFMRIDAIESRRIRKVYIARAVQVTPDADGGRDRPREKSERPVAHDPVEPA